MCAHSAGFSRRAESDLPGGGGLDIKVSTPGPGKLTKEKGLGANAQKITENPFSSFSHQKLFFE